MSFRESTLAKQWKMQPNFRSGIVSRSSRKWHATWKKEIKRTKKVKSFIKNRNELTLEGMCERERELIVETQRKDSFFFSPYFFDNRFIGRAFLLLPVCTKASLWFYFCSTAENKWDGMSLFKEELDSSLSLTVFECDSVCMCWWVSDE